MLRDNKIIALDDPRFMYSDPEFFGLLLRLIPPKTLNYEDKSAVYSARLLITEAIRNRLMPGVIIQSERLSDEEAPDGLSHIVELIDRESEQCSRGQADNFDDAFSIAYMEIARCWQQMGLTTRQASLPRTGKKPFLRALLAARLRRFWSAIQKF